MVSTALVNLWDHRVGAIAWNSETRIASFEFEPSFIETGLDIAPIRMPLNQSRGRVFQFPETRDSETFRGLPGLLADVLPDRYGNALINIWLARHGRTPDSLNPIELLCFMGKRGVGALEFEPATAGLSQIAIQLEIDELVAAARDLLSKREKWSTRLTKEKDQTMTDVLRVGTSAGGARAKAVIAYNPKTGEVRSGQANAPRGFSHWLIKFDGVHDNQFGAASGYGRVEMAYHLMALDAGVIMTPCMLYEENGRAHFMTRRFDRAEKNLKLHVQSFCALMHYDYNNVVSHSYEHLFQCMRMLRLPYTDAEQLFIRMAFNVMSRNCDDHTKNFSFLMNPRGEWRLSPAYDICHAYRPGSQWVSQHALSIQGKRINITRADLLAVAKTMNIKKSAPMLDRVKDVVSNWDQYARETGVSPKLRKAIGQTLWLV